MNCDIANLKSSEELELEWGKKTPYTFTLQKNSVQRPVSGSKINCDTSEMVGISEKRELEYEKLECIEFST